LIPLNLWELSAPIKALYADCMEPVCHTYHITRMELDILLFLANNPKYDTAAEIIEIRYLAKSHVSTSLKTLEAEGYLKKYYKPEDKRVLHLSICSKAAELISAGRQAQENFLSIMLDGFQPEERKLLKECHYRIQHNINLYFKETKKDAL